MSKTKKKTINDYLLKQITSVEDLKKNVRGMPLEECLNNLSLGLGDVRYLDIENPLITEPWNNYELVPELLVKMFRDPAYFHFFCKYVLNVELQPYQNCILRTLWHKPLPILLASRGAAKTFCLALYTILKLLFHPGCKVVVVGAGLRQSKLVFNYINTIYEKAPILRDIANDYPKERIDSCTWSVGYSEAIFIPLGNGEKIRGLRASTIICDEFSSISAEIFETVIRGFAAVKSEGLTYNIAEAYKKELFNKLGLPTDDQIVDKNILTDNQIILSGTPSYQFNHFYKYFSYYRDVITGEINSKGSKEYAEIIQKQIDPRDYAIIRIPYEVLPKGMMDEKILMQGKATMDPQIFSMEFQVIFPSDSDGFFLASWVHKATAPIKIGNDICTFKPKLYCDPSSSCVMGVDPASEDDRFAVCIMELMGPVRGVVYVWSTTRKEFEQLKRDGLVANDIDDYNTFCVKHIRHLVKRFNVKMVVMDAGGGGLAIKEGLKDKTKLLDSTDSPILDMDDENSQGLHGEHILKMIQFQNNEWRVNSHHGLRKDLLDMKVLFPEYDGAAIESGNVHDSITGKVFDTAEGCYYEIEQCKQETILIRHSRTVNGAEKWDVPKIMGLDAEHVRKQLKRDRFTALLLANWGCRLVQEERPYDGEAFTGGSAKDMKGDMSGLPYVGRGVGRLKGVNSLCVTSVKATETSYGSGRKIVY